MGISGFQGCHSLLQTLVQYYWSRHGIEPLLPATGLLLRHSTSCSTSYLALPEGLEPPTYGFEDRYSSSWATEALFGGDGWSWTTDFNVMSVALWPTELHHQNFWLREKLLEESNPCLYLTDSVLSTRRNSLPICNSAKSQTIVS